MEELLIKLFTPLIESLVEKEVEKRMADIEMPLELTSKEARQLTGMGWNKLKDVMYANREEVEEFVFFGEGQQWRFLRKPFVNWWENNFSKTKLEG